MLTHIAYGLNNILFKGVVTMEMAREIWDRYEGVVSMPNFIWIQREPSEDEINKFKKEHPEYVLSTPHQTNAPRHESKH